MAATVQGLQHQCLQMRPQISQIFSLRKFSASVLPGRLCQTDKLLSTAGMNAHCGVELLLRDAHIERCCKTLQRPVISVLALLRGRTLSQRGTVPFPVRMKDALAFSHQGAA